MKFKTIAASLLLITMLSLAACSEPNEADNEIDKPDNELNDSEAPSSDENALEPPTLTINAGREMLTPILGAYSWTVDNEDGTQRSIVVDAAAPPGLVRTAEPIQVTQDTEIELDFEEEPDTYSVRIWDEDNTIISTSDNVDLSSEGEVIYEVLAHWTQGTASYAFLLSID